MAWRLGGAPRAEEPIRLLRPGSWQAAGGGLAQAGAARPEAYMMVKPGKHSRGSIPTLANTGHCSKKKQAHVVSAGKHRPSPGRLLASDLVWHSLCPCNKVSSLSVVHCSTALRCVRPPWLMPGRVRCRAWPLRRGARLGARLGRLLLCTARPEPGQGSLLPGWRLWKAAGRRSSLRHRCCADWPPQCPGVWHDVGVHCNAARRGQGVCHPCLVQDPHVAPLPGSPAAEHTALTPHALTASQLQDSAAMKGTPRGRDTADYESELLHKGYRKALAGWCALLLLV